MYKLQQPNQGEGYSIVLRLADHVYIPFDEANTDYQAYLKWLDGYELQITEPFKMDWVKTSEGNTPLPPDEVQQ